MGIKKGLTHCYEEMRELKEIVIEKKFQTGNGTYKKINNYKTKYIEHLSKNKIKKQLKVVVACGNGAAGIFAPEILKNIGCEVVELDCNLDYSFPKYNPNPEDLKMLHSISKSVNSSTLILFWQFLLKGLDELSIVANPILSLEMLVIKLLHLKNMPSYEELIKNISNEQTEEKSLTDEKIANKVCEKMKIKNK